MGLGGGFRGAGYAGKRGWGLGRGLEFREVRAVYGEGGGARAFDSTAGLAFVVQGGPPSATVGTLLLHMLLLQKLLLLSANTSGASSYR